MGLFSRSKKSSSININRCGFCGSMIKTEELHSNYEINDTKIFACDDCTPKALAILETLTIIKDKKRDLNLTELRRFSECYGLKGGIKKIGELSKMIERNDIISNNASRFDSFYLLKKGEKYFCYFSCRCPYCKKKFESNSEIPKEHLDGRYGPITKSLSKLLPAFFYADLKQSIEVPCTYCKQNFFAVK